MFNIECYVYRTFSGENLFLSIIPPTTSKNGKKLYVQYDRHVPKSQRYRLPINGVGSNTWSNHGPHSQITPLNGVNKLELRPDLFPEVGNGEYKRVFLSISDANALDAMCDSLDMDRSIVTNH